MVASKNDWQLLISSFVVEMLFSFVHETVYGCQVRLVWCCHFSFLNNRQDTPEDLALGVFSVSILFGYAGSKRIVMALTVIYLGVLCSALCAADLHWLVLSVIPAYVLLTEAYRVRMDDPKSCGIYARRALYAKIAVCITAALDLAYIHM
jgi:4-hydroxybenzoate polyprenyltransferase